MRPLRPSPLRPSPLRPSPLCPSPLCPSPRQWIFLLSAAGFGLFACSGTAASSGTGAGTTSAKETSSGTASAGGSGSAGSSGGGSTGGSTSSGGGPFGGCSADQWSFFEFTDCAAGTTCGCGQSCQTIGPDLQSYQRTASSTVCAQACATTADCLDPVSACTDGGVCDLNAASCALTGAYSPCSGSLPGDSLCEPVDVDGQGTELDVCFQGGAIPVGQGCDPAATIYRDNLDAGCARGAFCFDGSDAGVGFCFAYCDPSGNTDAGCPTGAVCQILDPNLTDLGFCTDGGF